MGIDYKLAKQLKDAGFESKDSALTGRSKPDKDGYVTPHLSELIEACGDEEFSIQIFKHGTSIGFPYRKGKDDMPICKTPEEAVANLWLKLNKNYER